MTQSSKSELKDWKEDLTAILYELVGQAVVDRENLKVDETKTALLQLALSCLPPKLEHPRQYLREHTELVKETTKASINSWNSAIDTIEANILRKFNG